VSLIALTAVGRGGNDDGKRRTPRVRIYITELEKQKEIQSSHSENKRTKARERP